MLHNCHFTRLLYKPPPHPTLMLLYYFISKQVYLGGLFEYGILLRTSGQSGSEETALVIIHLPIFSHILLHYSHPSIYTAIRVCHSNELRLASPVITTGAVLPLPNGCLSPCRAHSYGRKSSPSNVNEFQNTFLPPKKTPL